jgi:uncharacterized membrane protein SpoIIM required for sporulation
VASYLLARFVPEFAEQAIPKDAREQMEHSYAEPPNRGGFGADTEMAGYYIWNNAGIGIQCFACGIILCGFGGMFAVIFNACFLGAVCGYMDTTPAAHNFNTFIIAHAPFELMAIVFSGAAVMRLGFSYVFTKGLSRVDSLRRAGREVLPVMMAAIILFVLAAGIEGYVSASGVSREVRYVVFTASALMLVVYVILLGLPGLTEDESEDEAAEAVIQEV